MTDIMTDTHTARDFLDLLRSQELTQLLELARRDYLSWGEFLRMPLPATMSALDTWELLGAVRRAEAETIPTPAPDKPRFWFTRTLRMSEALSVIDRECGFNSHLYRTITAGWGLRFLLKSRVGEIAAAARMDGLDVAEGTVQRLLHEERSPRNGDERLVVNMMDVMSRLPDYVDRPFTLDLMREFRELLLDGIDPESLLYTGQASGLLRADHRRLYAQEEARMANDEGAAFTCALANNEIDAPYSLPAIRALTIGDRLTITRPLPDMNSPVGRLMSQLYALKNGLPVLAFLPITRAEVMWAQGQPPFDDLSIQPHEYFAWMDADPYDFTPSVALILELVLRLLTELQDNIQRAKKRDAELLEILRYDPSLNHRQRLIISRAMRNPQAEFRVAYHKTNHGITQTTARRDLVALVNAGYLRFVTRGRAFVYLPVPDLQERIGVCPTDRS